MSKKLEAVQGRVSRKVLGASRSVAGVGVQGDLGWKKLEARGGREDAVWKEGGKT